MTYREAKQPQDFQKMCKQAERDHESKKLVVLIERVKRQLEQRDHPPNLGAPKPPMAALTGGLPGRVPSRLAIFER
jgi:hypothetical protein